MDCLNDSNRILFLEAEIILLKTFPLDDKKWPLKKESLTKTECS